MSQARDTSFISSVSPYDPRALSQANFKEVFLLELGMEFGCGWKAVYF